MAATERKPQMTLSTGDQNIVSNIRLRHKERVTQYSDEHIARVWRDFSLSDEYPDDEAFLEWLAMEATQ